MEVLFGPELKNYTLSPALAAEKVESAKNGDICALVGIEDFEIGDTILWFENPEPLDPIAVDEPTMSMLFTINNSPFYGKEGKFVTSRHIYEKRRNWRKTLHSELRQPTQPMRGMSTDVSSAPFGFDWNHAPQKVTNFR